MCFKYWIHSCCVFAFVAVRVGVYQGVPGGVCLCHGGVLYVGAWRASLLGVRLAWCVPGGVGLHCVGVCGAPLLSSCVRANATMVYVNESSDVSNGMDKVIAQMATPIYEKLRKETEVLNPQSQIENANNAGKHCKSDDPPADR